MDIEKLIEMLFAARYKDKGDNHDFPVVFGENQKLAIKSKVYEWAGQQIGYTDTLKRIAELEAKCYAYEQIIANSNFAPIIDHAKERERLAKRGIVATDD